MPSTKSPKIKCDRCGKTQPTRNNFAIVINENGQQWFCHPPSDPLSCYKLATMHGHTGFYGARNPQRELPF